MSHTHNDQQILLSDSVCGREDSEGEERRDVRVYIYVRVHT